MSRTRIRDIVTLTREGWRPYESKPDRAVYDSLGCKPGRKPFWFMRGDVFCCIGCSQNCTLKRPRGFPQPQPIRYQVGPRGQQFALTPAEMLAKYNLLTVRQVAYILNISERTVYDYIAAGKLVRLKEAPIRVRSREVRELSRNFDE